MPRSTLGLLTGLVAALVAAPLVGGCGKPLPAGGQTDLSVAGDPTVCSPLVTAVADEGATHIPFGTPWLYHHNPPASGFHWPWPHPWGAYDEAIPPEWWVHNLEHGGVVLLFNCGGVFDLGTTPDGGAPPDLSGPWPCPEITTPLRELLAERTPDEFGEVRMLVTSDPAAPHKVSAVAWDWLYQSDSIDLAALRCFRDMRYGRGPEHAP
jgi:hypothetical protein